MSNGSPIPYDASVAASPGPRNRINPQTINADGSFILTDSEVAQYGNPMTLPDILVSHFDLADIGEQRQIIDAGLVEAAENDRQAQQSLEMPGMDRSRHSRAAALRRALPGVEILPNPSKTFMGKILAIGDIVSLPIPPEAVLMRVCSNATLFLSFSGNPSIQTVNGFIENGGFVIPSTQARLFFCDSIADVTFIGNSTNAFLSVEFWTEIV